jgi:hypothetical protein
LDDTLELTDKSAGTLAEAHTWKKIVTIGWPLANTVERHNPSMQY